MSRVLLFPLAVTALLVGPAAVFFYSDMPRDSKVVEDGPLQFADWPISESAKRGRHVFDRFCAGCHGDLGLGDGEAAELLDPKPRNFQKGFFKFRTTQFAQLPMEADLMRTVTCGLPGSSMPGFPLVPEAQRRDVVNFVIHLALYGRAKFEAGLLAEDGKNRQQILEQIPTLKASIEKEMLTDRARLPIPVPKPSTPASIERGRTLFAKQCASCHGETGRGDGFSSYWLRDWKDAEIIPRDLTTGVYRAGNGAVDLFLRVRGGLSGTPMPGFDSSEDDVWAMVHYIQSLVDPGRIPLTRRMGCEHAGGHR